MGEIFSFISDCGLARGKMHAEVKVFADRVEIKKRYEMEMMAKQTTIYFDSVTAISHKMSKGFIAVRAMDYVCCTGGSSGYGSCSRTGNLCYEFANGSV